MRARNMDRVYEPGPDNPMYETFKVRARKGAVSMIESSFGYYEVWAVDGSLGEPQRFTAWAAAVEAYEYALAGERVLP